VNRVSLGAQSFTQSLLAVLERRAGPDAVRRSFYHLRDAGFDNISLDLLYGVPGQGPADLEHDLCEAIALGPEHLSCYELEAKEGTRFAAAWGAELLRQSDAMEGYYERVVDALVDAGYRWYETANFCRDDHRAAHNLAYWAGRDYLGVGVGAVSTVGGVRWRNRPSVGRYLAAADRGELPPRDEELLDGAIQARERLMLGLRLDEPVLLADVERALDLAAVVRLERLGLLECSADAIALTRRGRFLGSAVTVELLAESPANTPVLAG
jgi:oxygen-independent coproporphyrinogen-3 oxidase